MVKDPEQKRAYDRRYHALLPPERKLAKLERQYERLREIRQKVRDYLAAHPCVDCDEEDAVVLEFDHVRGKKDANIGDATRLGWGWARIKAEIEKCEVRCANCHRRKTYERRV